MDKFSELVKKITSMLFQFFGGLIKYAYKVHSDVSAAVDDHCSVSGNHSFRFYFFFSFRNNLEMFSGNFFQ